MDKNVATGESQSPPSNGLHYRKDSEVDTISETASYSSGSTGSTISPHYNSQEDVILHLEFLPDKKVKRIILSVFAAILLGIIFLIIALIYKLAKPHNYFFQTNSIYIANTVIAACQIVALSGFSLYFLFRLWTANMSGKRWSHRRKRSVGIALTELTLQLTNSVLFLVPNAYVLDRECAWFNQVTIWTAFFSWTIWNTLFCLFVIQLSSAIPLKATMTKKWYKVPYRPDSVVMDAPIWVHWPKVLLLWLPLEMMTLGLSLTLQYDPNEQPVLQPGENCQDLNYNCSLSTLGMVFTNMVIAGIIGYLSTYIWYLWRILAYLKHRPYNKYRIGNILVRLQARLRFTAFIFFTLTTIVYTYVDWNTCSSFVISWFGYTPMQVVMTALVIAYAYFATPKDPEENSILVVWLQEFAWAEADIDRKKAERSSSLPPSFRECRCDPQKPSPNNNCIHCEPMFCYETAIKLMYWAYLAYDLREDGTQGLRFNSDTGLALYDLEQLELVWEKQLDSRALIAWSSDTVVVSFRGTASLSNVLADIQAWRMRYPKDIRRTMLGICPRVHTGFLKAYLVNRFNERLLERVLKIVHGCAELKHSKPVNVYICGHSLGGALAMICAADLKRRICCPLAKVNIRVYTFGAPRVGNHTFVKYYDELIPDTWQLVNADDMVVRAAKFLFLFKHAGKRVVINRKGDMLVRPSYIEVALRRSFGGGSVKDHYLTSYQRAMLAVAAAQFGSKALGPTEEVLALANDQHTRAVLASTCSNVSNSVKGGAKTSAEASEFCTRLKSLKEEEVETGEEVESKELGDIEQGVIMGTAEEEQRRLEIQQQQKQEATAPSEQLPKELEGVVIDAGEEPNKPGDMCVIMKMACRARGGGKECKTICQMMSAGNNKQQAGKAKGPRSAARGVNPMSDFTPTLSTQMSMSSDDDTYVGSSSSMDTQGSFSELAVTATDDLKGRGGVPLVMSSNK